MNGISLNRGVLLISNGRLNLRNTEMKFFRPIVLMCAILFFVVGCKDDPVASDTDYGSEAAADGFSTSIGTESGGAGASLGDGTNLAEGFTIGNGAFGKNPVQARDSSYDDVTKMHTITLTRERAFGNSNYSASLIYRYTFFTGPIATADFTKGVTTKIDMTVDGRLIASTPRIDLDDTSHADWEFTNLGAGGAPPTLNGTYWRSGTHTLTTAAGGKQVDVEQTITFNNNELHRDDKDSPIWMTGTATSHYTATGQNGLSIVRDVDATFNGEGTATLVIWRTNPQGTFTDTATVDIKRGRFMQWGKR
jgi:hypothetical protein